MFEDQKNLSKFEKEFLQEFLEDISKRENSQWSKHWSYTSSQNAFSQHKYSGLNALYLSLLEYKLNLSDPRYATYNQAKKNGYHVAKGSKGFPIQFFTFLNAETGKEWDQVAFEEKIKGMTDEEIRNELAKKRILVKNFYVFNAKDLISNENGKTFTENNPIEFSPKKITTNELVDLFEKTLIENMNIEVREQNSGSAFYSPSQDHVVVPLIDQFNSYEDRVSTLLHELGHATGHKSRLNRDLTGSFGTKSYKLEELRVELNSVFMTNLLGLNLSSEQRENHLLYLDGWGKEIKENPTEFLGVLKDSLKIKEYMIEKGNYEELFLEKQEELKQVDLLKDNWDLQEVSSSQIQEAVEIWTEQNNLASLRLISNDNGKYTVLDNTSGECYVEEFSNKDLALGYFEVDYTPASINDFLRSYDLFMEREYGKGKPYENILSEDLKDTVFDIAYEGTKDNMNLMSFDTQISFDLANCTLKTTIENDFFTLSKTEDYSLDELTFDLKDHTHADFINRLKIDNEYLKKAYILSVYLQNPLTCGSILSQHDIQVENFNLDKGLQLRNELLKDITSDDPFYKSYIDKNFLFDHEFKHLVNYQLSHYEKVEELKQVGSKAYEINYIPDFEHDPSKSLKYSNYRDLWEEQFKEEFINDFDNFTLSEIKNNKQLNKLPNALSRISSNYEEVGIIIKDLPIEERDLDNDGLVGRIDIDDTRNAVQKGSDFELDKGRDKQIHQVRRI